jgi:hypothetical protein
MHGIKNVSDKGNSHGKKYLYEVTLPDEPEGNR